MEGLTFSASHPGNSPELPKNVKPAIPEIRSTPSTGGDTAADTQVTAEKTRPAAEASRPEASEPDFQARLNYDEEKALLFVEILDQATGDVVQRIPAESAAERIHELTGTYGGNVLDKTA